MKATTIKVEGKLLQEIERLKPRNQSVTSYVREALEREVRAHKLAEAAERYEAFMAEHADERAMEEEWLQADLEYPPDNQEDKT
jgi:hypothetical protein